MRIVALLIFAAILMVPFSKQEVTGVDRVYQEVAAALYPSFDEEKCGAALRGMLRHAADPREKERQLAPIELQQLKDGKCVDQYFQITLPETAQRTCDEAKASSTSRTAFVAEHTVSGILVLRVPTFGWYYTECKDWHVVAQSIAKGAATRMRNARPQNVILDLRGNGGGWLDAALYFLNETSSPRANSLIVTKKDRWGKKKKLMTSGKGVGCPLAILVDSGTASAAELAAAVIRDWCSTPIFGERTFRKGIVQTAAPGAPFKLYFTETEYFIGVGEHKIHGIGIEPDVVFKPSAPRAPRTFKQDFGMSGGKLLWGGWPPPESQDPLRDLVVQAAKETAHIVDRNVRRESIKRSVDEALHGR